MEEKEQLWQVRIQLTQAPQPFVPNPLSELGLREWQEPDTLRTFLFDPVLKIPPTIFGMEMRAERRLDVVFFTHTKSELEAYEIGHAWFMSLKSKFMGLDGDLRITTLDLDLEAERQFEPFKTSKQEYIFEILIPQGLERKKINILKKFIKYFYSKGKEPIRLFLLWKRETEYGEPDKILYCFQFKIFIVFYTEQGDFEEYYRALGLLRYFTNDILTDEDYTAELIRRRDLFSSDLVDRDIFRQEKEDKKLSKSIFKHDIDLDFPEDLPLPRLPILNQENVRYIDIDDRFIETSISVGYHVKEGLVSPHTIYCPTDEFSQDLVIFGKSGTGKTYFLANIVKELKKKREEVGILVLNVAKHSQSRYYQDFKSIKYSDDDFHIPYFTYGRQEDIDKHLQETASYICASLGLKNIFEKLIYRSLKAFMNQLGEVPERCLTILESVEHYMDKNPYGAEVQSNLLQALRNRKNIFDDDKVQEVLRVNGRNKSDRGKETPECISDWIGGANYFIDLSMCNKFIKLLIVNAFFQAVRALTDDSEEQVLRHIIVIDEAHAILEKPITSNSDDSDFIMKEQMSKIFSELLKEYRSRGIGFIIVDQSPIRLFDDVSSMPSIKVLFRQDYPNNTLFSEDNYDRQVLTQLPNRFALVMNGATGEKYLIKTLEFEKELSCKGLIEINI